MNNDALNTLVTSAIWRAEQLEERGINGAFLAWEEVSSLEDELAKTIEGSQPEGRIARRGAVHAALKAGNYARARELATSYAADESSSGTLKATLKKILSEYDRKLAERFRYAAKHHGLDEARSVALRLRETGAFGLAA